MLDELSSCAAGQRKDHWEDFRLKDVPRFLFRAFNSESGGRPTVAINTTIEIVPKSFIDSKEGHEFYDMAEKEIFRIACMHYQGENLVSTEFSSWASSLHLVLCYAREMPPEKDTHIAVLDRKSLEPEVLVWHALHFFNYGIHEYLTHGIVRDKGYIAISFKDLFEHGLYDVFPEVESYASPCLDRFGHGLRQKMFGKLPTDITETEMAAIRRTASQFITLLGIEKTDRQLASEPWLRPGAVCTTGPVGTPFPDVKQWIELLLVMSQFPPEQKAKRKRDEPERKEDLRQIKVTQHLAKIQKNISFS